MAKLSNFKDTDMQLVIGWVLRLGVIISMCTVALGGVLYLYRHGHSIPNFSVFNGVPAFVKPDAVISGVLQWRGQAIIQLGIMLLVATPVLRVIFSAIGFMLEKDRLYTLISLLVLAIIIASIWSGHAG